MAKVSHKFRLLTDTVCSLKRRKDRLRDAQKDRLCRTLGTIVYLFETSAFFSETARNPLIGRPASFDVDTSGAGLGELAIQCRGPAGNVPVDVRPTGPGKYNVSFIPNKPGEYNIHFVFNGDDIPGSPIKTIVNDPNRIVAHGEGLHQVGHGTIF